MSDSATFSLAAFLADPAHRIADVTPQDLDHLVTQLCTAENPQAVRVLIWLLLHRENATLAQRLTHTWGPSETDLAQLLEEVGGAGTKVVLSLKGCEQQLDRLWRLSDDAELPRQAPNGTDPWKLAALAPMAALVAEQQLEALVQSVSTGRQWADPADVLNPDGESDFDLDAVLSLAQARLVQTSEGSEALNIALVRLLSHADRIN